MADWACQNPSCKSHGSPHPNCMCPAPMSEGGYPENFCKSDRAHMPECQYFAGGGEVQLPAGFELEPEVQAQASEVPAGFELEEDKYGSFGQQALTALEGVGEGIAGPVFTALERASGLTTPEDMRARREVNPTIHGVGQVAGLAGSALIPGGQAGLLAKAGTGAAKMANMGRVGSTAVKAAAEMALFQGGDELSKMIMEDPNQSFQTAVTNVGLATAMGLGGGIAFGSINPLWEASGGPKLSQFAKDFGDRMRARMAGEVEAGLAPSFGDALQSRMAGLEVLPQQELSAGAKLADKMISKGLKKLDGEELGKMAGRTMGATVGGAIGLGSGGYWGGALGALIGERALTPFFDKVLPAVAKPILEGIADGPALKNVMEYAQAIAKGQRVLNTAVKGVFVPGAEVLASKLIPTEKDREKLMDRIEEIESDPEQQFLMNDAKFVQYLPDHGGARGSTLGAAFELLKAAKPKSKQTGPLDQVREPSKAEMADYENTLNLAQQPAMVFPKIKDGTITGRDIDLIKTVYPALYNVAVQKLTAEMIERTAKGDDIPYKTRIGLSKFFGEPLDASMLPGSIAAAQAAGMSAPSEQPAPQGAPSAAKMAPLGKGADLMATRMQSSEERHKAQF